MQQTRRKTWLVLILMLCALFLAGSLSPAQATAPDSGRGMAEIPEFSLRTGWGIITWDETWQGTIHLKGDVLVDNGFNLTIKPGATIIFDAEPDPNKEITAQYHFIGRHEITVGGSLYASGTPQRPITFRNVQEPYYPINLSTRVLGDAVLKHVETSGVFVSAGTSCLTVYGDSTIYSSTFHGDVELDHTTFCSNTVEGYLLGWGFIWNNTIEGTLPLRTMYSYPSHIAGNTFDIRDGAYGLMVGLDDCFAYATPDSADQCRIMIENNFFNGGLEGIRISGRAAPPDQVDVWGPPQVFIRNNRFEGQTYGISLYGGATDSDLTGKERIYMGDFYPGEDGLDDGGNSFINVNTLIYMRSVLWPWRYYPFDLKAEKNYWGYASASEIEAHMYDEDQVCGGSCDYVGDVDFVPFLKAEKRVVPPSEPCAVHGSPILLRTGDYTFQTTDLSLALVGSDLEMIRTYHTQDGFDGPLGPGWSMAYFIQAISTQQGDDTQVIVRLDDGTRMVFHRQSDGSYLPTEVWDATLTQSGGLYQLEMLNGETYSFNANGWLAVKTDRAGNAHSVTYTPQGRVSQILDGNGRGVTFTYSAQGKIDQMQDHGGRAWTYSYDADGFLIQATDPAGQSFGYTYDSSGNLSGVSGPDGQQLQHLAHNPSDQVTGFTDSGWPVLVSYYPTANQASETDGYGNQTEFTYNDQGQRTNSTDPLGRTTQQSWDTSANNTGTTTPGGAQFSTTFDANGFPETHTDALNQTWQTAYGADGQLQSITDRRGGETHFSYDSQGNQTAIIDTLGNTTTFVYDSAGQLGQVTSPEGRTVIFQHDPQSGAVISAQDGLSRAMTFAVDSLGRHVIYTDTLGHDTQIEYDELDQITGVIDPLNQTTSYGYDVYGNIAAITNTAGHTLYYESDAHGQLYTEVDPLGNTWFWDYDLRGLLAGTIDPADRASRYDYDAAGQLTSITSPQGAVYQLAYDTDGNLIRWEDPEGNLTNYEYDALGRLASLTDTLGYKTTYGYDPDGNPIQMQNARMQTTQYSYDAEGKLTAITNPAAQTLAYTYYADGMRKTRQELDGSTFTFTYDAAGQLTQAAHTSGASLTLGYSAPGQVDQFVDSSGTVDISYDALGRPDQATDVFNNVVSVAYGANGQPQSLALPGGLAVAYTYDNAERLQTAQFNGVTLQFELNPVGEVITQTWTGGPSILTQYNTLGMPTQRTVTRPGGATLTEHSAAYDSLGRRVTFDSSLGQVSYTYDAMSQLNQVVHPTLGTVNYAFDGVGNRTSAGGVTASYDNLNRLTSTADGVGYTYDGNNRRATRTGGTPHTYSYDHRHLLTEVDFGDGAQTEYTYDGRGKLVQTTHLDGTVTRYVYFGDQLVAITDGANAVQIQLIYGVRPDVPVALVIGGQAYMLITDAIGTVHGLVDQSGNLVAGYTYGPWGEVLSEAGAVDQPLRFSGRIYDQDNRLALHGLRWYDPAAGVFLTPDPLAYELDGILMVNHYRYVDGDPVNRVDITGLQGLISTWQMMTSKQPYHGALDTSPQERALRVRQFQGYGKRIWDVSKLTPVVGSFTSAIDAAWYLGSGTVKYIRDGDTTELKKFGSELAGIGAGLAVPGCRAGASLAKKALKEGLSIAAGYLTGKAAEGLLNAKWNPGTQAPAPFRGSPPLYGHGSTSVYTYE